MTTTKQIDDIDAIILKDLLKDGRKEFTQIAKEAQVSKDIIWQHYNKMKKEGIIIGATIQLNYAALGYNLSASFLVDTPVGKQQQVTEQLRKVPGIYDAYRWGSHSRLWAVSDLMKADQIEPIKHLIKRIPSVLKLEVEIWTGMKRLPENLSVITERLPTKAERTETVSEERKEVTHGEIDKIDRQIIDRLAADGRAPFSSIGKDLGISTSTAIRRYSNLKRNGIINTLIQINPAKLGYPFEAGFRLTIDSQRDLNKIAKRIAEVPDVVGILKTSGAHDLTINAETKSLDHLVALETEIANIQGIREMEAPMLNQFPILPYPREHMSTF